MIAASRLTLLLACSALLSPLLPAPAGAQSGSREAAAAAAPRGVRVELNGGAFARGVALREADQAPRLLVDLEDLQAAVDGTDPRPRLIVRGGALYATAAGSCAGCLLRVQRPVLISARIERVVDRLYVPLEDVVRALEGRVVETGSPDAYGIHVGVCTWCILEPLEPQRRGPKPP